MHTRLQVPVFPVLVPVALWLPRAHMSSACVCWPACLQEIEWNPKFQCESLVKKFVSQASAKQRAGRCGRLSPGTVFRLYPTIVFEQQMAPYDLPELLRVSLASTILRLKMTADSGDADGERREKQRKESALGLPQFDPSVCNLNDPHSVLSECMQAPELSSIDAAYEELLKNGAVQLAPEGASLHKDVSRFGASAAGPAGAKPSGVQTKAVEHFSISMSSAEKRAHYQASICTPLGRFFAALPFSFHLSRLVALGVCFGPRFLIHSVCISAALSMAEVYLMPMQSRGAQGGGGGGDRRDRNNGTDPFPRYVSATTSMRMWSDAGIQSDAIAIIRTVDAYLKYRQHVSELGAVGVGGLGRRSRLLDDWCAERGVHMKRIATLTSSIAEISLRLSGLVHQEAERDALLQLAALCGNCLLYTSPSPRD